MTSLHDIYLRFEERLNTKSCGFKLPDELDEKILNFEYHRKSIDEHIIHTIDDFLMVLSEAINLLPRSTSTISSCRIHFVKKIGEKSKINIYEIDCGKETRLLPFDESCIINSYTHERNRNETLTIPCNSINARLFINEKYDNSPDLKSLYSLLCKIQLYISNKLEDIIKMVTHIIAEHGCILTCHFFSVDTHKVYYEGEHGDNFVQRLHIENRLPINIDVLVIQLAKYYDVFENE